MTTADVAKYLQMNPWVIRTMAKQGKIPSLKIGRRYRFRRQDIEEFLKPKTLDRLTAEPVIPEGE